LVSALQKGWAKEGAAVKHNATKTIALFVITALVAGCGNHSSSGSGSTAGGSTTTPTNPTPTNPTTPQTTRLDAVHGELVEVPMAASNGTAMAFLPDGQTEALEITDPAALGSVRQGDTLVVDADVVRNMGGQTGLAEAATIVAHEVDDVAAYGTMITTKAGAVVFKTIDGKVYKPTGPLAQALASAPSKRPVFVTGTRPRLIPTPRPMPMPQPLPVRPQPMPRPLPVRPMPMPKPALGRPLIAKPVPPLRPLARNTLEITSWRATEEITLTTRQAGFVPRQRTLRILDLERRGAYRVTARIAGKVAKGKGLLSSTELEDLRNVVAAADLRNAQPSYGQPVAVPKPRPFHPLPLPTSPLTATLSGWDAQGAYKIAIGARPALPAGIDAVIDHLNKLTDAAPTTRIVAEGVRSKVKTAGVETAVSAYGFAALWAKHSSKKRPKVDFSDAFVVARFAGEGATGGVTIDAVERIGDDLHVTTRRTAKAAAPAKPFPGLIRPPFFGKHAPYAFAVIDKAGLQGNLYVDGKRVSAAQPLPPVRPPVRPPVVRPPVVRPPFRPTLPVVRRTAVR
jgi:hypothetical protein